MKNILITLWYADGLHGVVKYSAELGNYFYSLGYKVYLCGCSTNQETKEFFAENHVTMFNIQEELPDIVFDIVWAHHWPIFPYLIRKGLKYRKLVNSCISSVLYIERPLILDENIDLYLCLTNNMKKMFVEEYGLSSRKIQVLPNIAPDEFFSKDISNKESITSIGIVSNHVPQELLQALYLFRNRNINVVVYGGSNSINITPDILRQHDVIITIGKTVQYCLAIGKPVYEYDHFGGSGYIVPDNIILEESYVFSGRSFCTKKTAEEIVEEIFNQYHTVLAKQEQLRQIAEQRYKLSIRIDKILEILSKTKNKKMLVEDKKSKLFIDYCDLIINGMSASSLNMNTISNNVIIRKESQIQRLLRHLRTFRF